MTFKHFMYGVSALFALTAGAGTVHAYFSPEDVLLNKDLYLPPTARESQSRRDQQQQESVDRLQREQNILFKEQHPVAPESSSVSSVAASDTLDPTKSLSQDDQALLRTARLLERVQKSQAVLQYGGRVLPGDGGYHQGAPLAPTGAGGVLSAIVMVGAVGWTVVRAKIARKTTRVG